MIAARNYPSIKQMSWNGMIRMRKASLAAVLALSALPTSLLAADFREEFPAQFTDTPLGVNLQTGRFRYWAYSFSMGPFQLERGFNKSGFPFLGMTFVRTLPTAGGTPMYVRTVKLGDLSLDFFNLTSPDMYIPQSLTAYDGWRLQKDNPDFTLVHKSGTTYKFTEYGSYDPPKARVTLITYADGSTINVSYDSSGRVTFLESNRGYAVRFEHLSSGAQVKICGFNLSVTYATASTSCSGSNYVVTVNNTIISSTYLRPDSVVDLAGLTSTLTYAGTDGPGATYTPGYVGGLLQCMTLPNSSTCEFNNSFGPQPGEPTIMTKPDQVRIQTDANNNTYTYSYDNGPTGDDPPPYPGGPPVLSGAIVAGPGFSAQANYENGLLKILSAPGGGPNYFEYSGLWPSVASYSDGRAISIGRNNIGVPVNSGDIPVSGSGLATVSQTRSVPLGTPTSATLCSGGNEKLCAKPTSTTDGNGNQTDYTYAAHGGMLTMTLPAGANGIRPQTRYEYAQRYALVKNSSGSFVQASSPIWVKTRERFCKTTAASGQSCAGGAADEVITDYDYGPTSGAANNLLLRGVAVTADGVTRRSCYSYDANGRKISETQPMASLGVCP